MSKQATAGTWGSIRLTHCRPRKDFGWCRGARSDEGLQAARRTCASTRTGAVNSLPPWTIRWPTASIGLVLGDYLLEGALVHLARGSGKGLRAHKLVVGVEHRQLEAAGPGIDDKDAHLGQGVSRARSSRGFRGRRRRPRGCRPEPLPARQPSAGAARQRVSRGTGTRSITSITRWKRSRSFSMTMSNGVVVVPSSL